MEAFGFSFDMSQWIELLAFIIIMMILWLWEVGGSYESINIFAYS